MSDISFGLPGNPFPAARHGWHSARFLVLLVLIVFSPLLAGGTTHLAMMGIRFLLVALFLTYWTETIRAKEIRWPRLTVGYAVGSFLLLAGWSTVTSPYTHQSLQWFVILFAYALLLYLVVWCVRSLKVIQAILAVLLGMVIIEGGWVLFQQMKGTLPRPTGSYFNPNFLAGYVAAIGAIPLASIIYSPRRVWPMARWNFKELWRSLTLLVLLGCVLWIVLATGSRGGLIAFVTGTGLVLILRFGWKGCFAIGAFVILLTAVNNPLRDRVVLEHLQNPETYARWQMWSSSLQSLADHPSGVGLGLYQYAFPAHAFPIEGQIVRYGKTAQTPHSEYVQIGVELGIIGLLIFLTGIGFVARQIRRLLKQRLNRTQRAMAVGMTAGGSSILVHSVFDSNLHEPGIAILLTVYIGLLHAMPRCLDQPSRQEMSMPIRSRPVWAIGGAVIMLVAMGYAFKVGVAYLCFESASELIAKGEVKQGIERFRTAIALDEEKALYHHTLASTYFSLYEQAKSEEIAEMAITEMREAVRLNPLDGRLQGLLGTFLLTRAGMHREQREFSAADIQLEVQAAEDAFKESEKRAPFSYRAPFQIAQILLARGQREQALACLRRVIELEPNFLPARKLLALTYRKGGDVAMANAEFREIVERQTRLGGKVLDAREQLFLNVDVRELAMELKLDAIS